jgi:SAM-dependent methyltransferase
LGGGRPYDVIVFADVLEHLVDPRSVLRKVRSLLAPDGFVVASIPNVTHQSLVFELMNGRFEYRDFGLLDATHIRFFDYLGVLRLFEETGYVVETIERVSVPPSQTEFATEAVDDDDRFVLGYRKRRNPDSETFQFVVRAFPSEVDAGSEAGLVAAQRRAEILERSNEKLRRLVAQRESELRWLEQRPWNRIAEAVRRVVRKRPGQS